MARRGVKVVNTWDLARGRVIIQKGWDRSSSPKLGEVAQRAGGVCDNALVVNHLLLNTRPRPMLGRVAMPSAPHAELRSTRALPSPRALRGSGHPL